MNHPKRIEMVLVSSNSFMHYRYKNLEFYRYIAVLDKLVTLMKSCTSVHAAFTDLDEQLPLDFFI